jgi:hypothetical protein
MRKTKFADDERFRRVLYTQEGVLNIQRGGVIQPEKGVIHPSFAFSQEWHAYGVSSHTTDIGVV